MALDEQSLQLDFRADVTTTGLRVSYTLLNRTGITIGVFNRIMTVGADGTRNFLPENVYVQWENSQLHLRKMALPPPEGLEMTVRLLPHATRLEANATEHEEFVLALPVKVNHPYQRALLAGANPKAEIVAAEPRATKDIVFSLGVFPCDQPNLLQPVSAFPGVYRISNPGYADSHQLVVTRQTALQTPITVLDYRAIPRH